MGGPTHRMGRDEWGTLGVFARNRKQILRFLVLLRVTSFSYGFALTFDYGLEAVNCGDGELFDKTARPVDFEGFYGCGGAEAKMGTHVGG